VAHESDADGYVHVPGGDDDPASGRADGERAPPTDPDATPESDGRAAEGHTGADTEAEEGFGTRGWALVAAVVVSVLVIPGVIYALPGLLATTGFPFLVAMLALPLAPAALLGVVAVWSMAESGRR
jgi:hypothetical protein